MLRWRTSQDVNENSLRHTTARPRDIHVDAESVQRVSYEANGDQVTQLNAPQRDDDPQGAALRYRSPNRSSRNLPQGESTAPINDPFGDRQHQASSKPPARQPAESAWQSSSEAATQWQTPSTPQPVRLSSPEDISPQVQLASPASITTRTTEYYQDSALFTDSASPEEARDILHGTPISGINLNVTPWYGDEARTFEQEQAARETLRQNQRTSGPRTWTDRNGNPITQGYLTNFENRMIVIDEGNGQAVQVLVDELSTEDRQFVYSTWQLPGDAEVIATHLPPRIWVPQTVTWKASALCHKSLFFEDIQLERYGHSAGPFLQPVKSTAHFFGNMLIMPYNSGIHPVNECQYALGYYRPGDCAPWLLDPIPLSIRGGLRQAAFVTAGVSTIP